MKSRFLVEDHNRQCIIKQTTKNEEKLNLTENYFLLFSFHLTYFPVAVEIDVSGGISMFVTIFCCRKCTFKKRFKGPPELWITLWTIFSLSLLTVRQKFSLVQAGSMPLLCPAVQSLSWNFQEAQWGFHIFLAKIGHKNTFVPFDVSSLCVFHSLLSQHAAANGKGQAGDPDPAKCSGIWLHLNSEKQWHWILGIRRRNDVVQINGHQCLGNGWRVCHRIPGWPYKSPNLAVLSCWPLLSLHLCLWGIQTQVLSELY